MKFLGQAMLVLIIEIGAVGCRHRPAPVERESLVTGKGIWPMAKSMQDVGSMPINVVISPDGKFAVTSDMGWHQSLWSIRTADGKGISHIDIPNPKHRDAWEGEDNPPVTEPGSPKSNGLYYGLAIAKDHTLYAAQGGHDTIAELVLGEDGSLNPVGEIAARKRDFPAGVAVDEVGRLYVSNNSVGSDEPLQQSGSVAIYDRRKRVEMGRYVFSASHGGTTNYPLGIAALKDGSKVYVAAERDDAVYVLDTRNPAKPELVGTLATGAHPTAVLLSKDQKKLFVANSLSDTVSVINTESDRISDTVLLRPKMARDLVGATPIGLALSPDEKSLYVALGDMNAVALVGTYWMSLQGYISTGWYPTSLAATSDGMLLVANGRGSRVRNPNNKKDPYDPKHKNIGMVNVLEGNVSAIAIPTGDQLDDATDEVLRDNRLDKLERGMPNPLAGIGLSAGKIKHVIYVIKENRTYDQVLGDMPNGNGDKSLVLFGKNMTPNQHALADRFVLLDNFYACGDVSGDGWAWSTQGMADAYVSRNVPYSYSQRGRKFDYEGSNNGYVTGGFPAVDDDGKPLAKDPAFKEGAEPIPDVGSTGIHIWDVAREAGISIRNYGFFLSSTDRAIGTSGGPDNYPTVPGLQPAGRDLEGITDWDFRRFDLDYADSDAPLNFFRKSGDSRCLFRLEQFGKGHATSRFMEWNREFKMMLAHDPSGEHVPALMLVRFPMDHTKAARPGDHAPESYVADNDYAVGQLVEAISNSPIWDSTAICVLEDDAQSGVDHVDAHRTTAFIVSPWIKANSVDHHFYNTDSMLKTIELLLGLKPMSQYDAVADPILDWDVSPSNIKTFTATPPGKALISKTNPQVSQLRAGDPQRDWAMQSEKMDFEHADAAPAAEADEIVWKMVKGAASKMPGMRGRVVGGKGEKDED